MQKHFILVNGIWQRAKNIQIGDKLLSVNDEPIEVLVIEKTNKKVFVYNFEVEDNHTYIAYGVVVHNKCYLMDANGNKLLDKNGKPIEANKFTTNGHAIFGNGDNLRIDFNECLDTTCYESEDSIMKFEEYSSDGKGTGKHLSDYLHENSGKNFHIKIQDLRLPAQSTGEMAFVVGRYTLKLSNIEVIGNEEGWELRGTLKAFDDTFNYDQSNRKLIPETITTTLRNLQRLGGGKDFTLQIRGSKNLKIKGGWKK